MLSSSRFIVAVHVMCILARKIGKGPVCSGEIAQSVDTNPVVIRRLMSELERSALVCSTAGRSGGFALSKPSGEITLADIYSAVEDSTVFRMHKTNPEADCPVARQMGEVLVPKLRAAEIALTNSLATTRLCEVVQAFH